MTASALRTVAEVENIFSILLKSASGAKPATTTATTARCSLQTCT